MRSEETTDKTKSVSLFSPTSFFNCSTFFGPLFLFFFCDNFSFRAALPTLAQSGGIRFN